MSFSIKDLAIKAGTSVLTTLFPPAAELIPIVNGFLDDDDKLPESATGEQVTNALSKLSPEQMAMIESKKIDLQITESNNWAAVSKELSKADATGSTTRPKIALMFAWQVVIISNGLIFAVVYSAITKDQTVIKAVTDSWQMILALLGPMIAVIYQYFGKRTQEKNARISAATGQDVQMGILGSIAKKIITK